VQKLGAVLEMTGEIMLIVSSFVEGQPVNSTSLVLPV